MSINVMIGSDPKDIFRIQSTVNVLNELKTSLNQNSDSTTTIVTDHLEDLSKWYQDILNILYNGGSSEDYSVNPVI